MSSHNGSIAAELERVRAERDGFQEQYHGLLGKLTQMRTTLGDRLRQDAEELDKREQQIETLSTQVSSLQATVSTLKDELVGSHDETERLTTELDSLRSSLRGREVLEQSKWDAEAWESAFLQERAKREELETALLESQAERDRALAKEVAARQKAEREESSAMALQAVLEDLQSGQESELTRFQEKYDALAQTLSHTIHRTTKAEQLLSSYKDAAQESTALSAQVKEKNLLIGKLRHEAVILNEHLTEALRRLRNDQADASVDKKLVTNLFLQFLNTPRSDGKRFEMLVLIASVLGWSEQEKEAAGLQKRGSTTKKLSKSSVAGDESFSNLFVEFLLSEAERGGSAPSTPSKEGPSPK